jgi:hypothetical protein
VEARMIETTPTHVYIDGKAYLRVTHLLKVMFVDQEYKPGIVDISAYNEATQLGKQIDKLIQQDLQRQKLKWPKNTQHELKTLWEAYQEAKRITRFNPTGIQELVYSPKLGLVGHTDITEADGITDFKATAKLLRRHWLQVNTYVRLKWPNGYVNKIRRLTRLDKVTGMSDYQSRPYSEADWQGVLHMKLAYDNIYGELNAIPSIST